jgi:molybdate transport system substrate-binding protein
MGYGICDRHDLGEAALRTSGLLAVAAALAISAPAARAADLTVFATGSMRVPLQTAAAEFARAGGHRLTFVSGTTGTMMNRIKAGETFDVIAISDEAFDALETEGRTVPATRRPLAKALRGVGVRAGAPEPDISTPEAFKQAVVRAKSISYPDPALGATSGVYLVQLFDRLGIGPAARAKTVVKPVGAEVAEAAANGEVELAVTFISEMIPDKRIKVVGALPPAILNPTAYSIAVSSRTASPEAARALVAYVTGKEAAATLEAAGVDPAVKP